MSRPARKSAPAKKTTKPAAKKVPAKPFQVKPQHEVFAAEFCKDQCGKDAAIRAGYSARNAEQQASRLLARPEIRSLVDAGMARIRQQVEVDTGVTLQQVVRELGCMALYDPADIGSQPVNCPKDIEKLPEHVRRAIVGWSWDKHGNFVLKLAPKAPAADMLMKHLGGYERDNKQKGGVLADLLAQVTRSAVPIAKDLPPEGHDVG